MDRQRLETPRGYHLTRTFSVYRMGPADPTVRIEPGVLRTVQRTPEGPASVEALDRGDHLSVGIDGPGASWLTPRLPGLFGLQDDPSGFTPGDPAMRRIWKRSLGTHLPTLPTAFGRLVQVILLQLVTTAEAYRAWKRIVTALGESAPGAHGLKAPPSAETVARTAWYRFVADGVPHRQARTLVRCAHLAPTIEAAHEHGGEELGRTLASIPGLGPWTVAYMRGSAAGDPDAVLTGDHNLPHTAAWLLAGRERGTDELLLELLEPYRGHRFRVIRALWAYGVRAPRRGPRRAPRPLPTTGRP